MTRYVLWQLLDTMSNSSTSGKSQRRISSRNTSCVFTRELDREPQQYSTDYLYKVTLVHATTMYHPTLMSIPCPHVHYSSTMHLPQDHYAMFMYPNVILL